MNSICGGFVAGGLCVSMNILAYAQPACANRIEVSSICWGTLPEDSMYNPTDPDSPKLLTPEERASAFQHREAAHQTLVSLGFLETPEISGVEGEPEQSVDTSEVKRATWPPIWPS